MANSLTTTKKRSAPPETAETDKPSPAKGKGKQNRRADDGRGGDEGASAELTCPLVLPSPEVEVELEAARASSKTPDSPKTSDSPKTAAMPTTLDLRSIESRVRTAAGDVLDRVAPRKTGGVAPFVPPAGRLRRIGLRRRWERRGLVPLSPGRPKLRHRILPRSVIGISFMLLALAVGAAFSGAGFYAYYDNRLAENEESVARFVNAFDDQFADAALALDEARVGAVEEIRAELSPLGEYVTDANGVISLPGLAGPSVWQLDTQNEAGRKVTGSAFAIAPEGEGTALITSFSLVEASATNPSPDIVLVKGEQRIPAQLWAWDTHRDLAVLIVDTPIPTLELATANAQVDSLGSRVFAIGGVGGQGATASPGVLLDHSLSGLQHTAAIGSLFQGGPILDGEGKVIGMASLEYEPLGVDPGEVHQAPDVAAMCADLLRCAERNRELVIDVAAEEAEAPLSDLYLEGTIEEADTELSEDGEGTESGDGADSESESSEDGE